MDEFNSQKEIEENNLTISKKIPSKSKKGFWQRSISLFAKIGFVVVCLIALYLAFNVAVDIKASKLCDSCEQQPKIITVIELDRKLNAIGEFSTYSYEYTNQKTTSTDRKLFDKHIPGTSNEITMIYSGVIKVGYDIDEIECKVDDNKKLIFVTIPKIRVLDDYIILDNLECREKNNILNPIGTSQMTAFFEEIKAEELKLAKEKGIYEKAEEQLKTLITELFNAFEGYDVTFKQ